MRDFLYYNRHSMAANEPLAPASSGFGWSVEWQNTMGTRIRSPLMSLNNLEMNLESLDCSATTPLIDMDRRLWLVLHECL